MTIPDGERIAKLEQAVESMSSDLHDIKNAVSDIKNTLAQLSGGKRMLFTLAAIAGSVFAALATVMAAWLAPHH